MTPEPLRRPNKKTQKQLDEEEAALKAKAAALRRARAKRWNWIFFWRGKNMRKKLNKKGKRALLLLVSYFFSAVVGVVIYLSISNHPSFIPSHMVLLLPSFLVDLILL